MLPGGHPDRRQLRTTGKRLFEIHFLDPALSHLSDHSPCRPAADIHNPLRPVGFISSRRQQTFPVYPRFLLQNAPDLFPAFILSDLHPPGIGIRNSDRRRFSPLQRACASCISASTGRQPLRKLHDTLVINITDLTRSHFKDPQFLRPQSVADKMSKRTAAVLLQPRRTGLDRPPISTIQSVRQLASKSILPVVKLHAPPDPRQLLRLAASVPESCIQPVILDLTVLQIVSERIGQIRYCPLRRYSDFRHLIVLQIAQDHRFIRISMTLQENLQFPEHAGRPQLASRFIDPAAADIEPLLRLG